MSQKLPVGEFEWNEVPTEDDIRTHDLVSDVGYIVECDFGSL